jgi:hypothetical protein
MAGPFKYDQRDILTRMGASDAVVETVVNNSIPNAIRSGLGLTSDISLSGSVSSFTGARPTADRGIV